MLGPFNEEQLEEVFNRFENEVRTNTLSGFDKPEKKEQVSKYSDKVVKLHKLLQETDTFGCQKENVKKLVELLIDEELPPIVKSKKRKIDSIEKYHKRLCVIKHWGKESLFVINSEDESIDSLFDCTNVSMVNIVRLATSEELDSFFSLARQVINIKGGFDNFFNWFCSDAERLEYCWELFFNREQWEAIND